MADSVKKRCSKAKEVKAANKVELLKSCLDKKDFCGDAAYYSCMRKYFTLYPPESNNKSANKKNKVDACKGSMKFVPGDVVMGTLNNLIKQFSSNQTKEANNQLQNILGNKKKELKYRATVKKVDDKSIVLNFDDYHNFKKVISSTPQNPTTQKSTTQNFNDFKNSNIVAFLKSLKTTEDEPTTTGGSIFTKTQEEKNKNTQQSYQLGQLKNISIPFEEFNRSDAVKYKPSSVMGHIKKGAQDVGKIFELSIKPIINEGRPALSETKTNMGKDEESSSKNLTKVHPWTGKLKLKQMLPFDTKQEYEDKMIDDGKEPDKYILKLYEIYDNKYHLKLIEDTLNKINKEKSLVNKIKGTKKQSDTENALKKDLTKYLKGLYPGLYPKEAHIASNKKYNLKGHENLTKVDTKLLSTNKKQEGGDLLNTDNLNKYRQNTNFFDNKKSFDKNLSEFVNKEVGDKVYNKITKNNKKESPGEALKPLANEKNSIAKKHGENPKSTNFIKKIKKDVYNKEIIGIEKSDNIALLKRIKNFFENARRFRKRQIIMIAILGWAIHKFVKKKIFVGINILILAFFLYECFYSSIGDILIAAITVFLTIVLIGTIKGVLNIFSSDCESSSPDWDPDTNKLYTDRYVVSVLGAILLIMSLRTLCNFVPWLKLDWMLWKISLGIMILQNNIIYKGEGVETGINSAASFFFVLSCLNALYQYMIKNDSKKTIGLGDLENFADVLNSSYYMIDDTIEDV